MKFLLVLFSFVSLTVASIKIECDYKLVNFAITECETSGLVVKNHNDTVTAISGTLGAIVSYKKIKTLKVNSSPSLEYFPLGLETFFPNLENLIITQTGLHHFSVDDIKKFPNLTTLDLSDNQIEEINAQTFEFNDKLESINLSGNKLNNVGFDFMKHLKSLKSLNMNDNVCINATAQDPIGLKKMRINLNENCLKRVSNYGFYFSFFVLLLASGFFLILLISCIKWIVN